MEDKVTYNYSCFDFVFTFAGLFFFVTDIVLDALAVVQFYNDGDFIYLGLLLSFLLISSILAQVYSWLWYRYDNYETMTRVESRVDKVSLKVLHVLQLGVYFRYAGLLDVSVRSFFTKAGDPEGHAVFLSHDLSLLRLIETFSESGPQLVLMLTILLQSDGWREIVPLLKALGSVAAIACSVTLYHRSLRSFLVDKQQQSPLSSFIYFTWNLLLIFPRLAALALFASLLPCYIFTHFLCSWIVLSFFAWRLKTDFMDSAGGEWLFRATVGLIWYFSWFNAAEGPTKYRSLRHHVWMFVDMGLLCGLSCWQTYTASGCVKMTPRHAWIISSIIALSYITGCFIKAIYYKFFHPKLAKCEPTQAGNGFPPEQQRILLVSPSEDVTDFRSAGAKAEDSEPGFTDLSVTVKEEPVQGRQNQRMRRLAQNFYS